ncbi:MAG: hypothetical protein LC795_02930 [Acidobacteria bacterium]|nr:hypothetical protein [Acidobacteriota bacterium]
MALAALALLFACAALVTTPRTGEAGAAAQPSHCQGSIVLNGNFVMGNNQGTMPAPGSVAAWSLGYGAPQVFKTMGCADNGYVRLSGNKTGGNAIAQVFNPANKIKQGKKYVFSACVRNVPGAPFVKFRVVAFNGNLPAGTTHPAPGPSRAIVGHSGPINSTDWTQINLPSWTPGKDYDGFAIAAESNDGTVSVGDLDNVCLTEVSEVACEEAQTGSDGEVVFPANLDPDAPPVYEDVSEYNGSVADIYPQQCNTEIDTWYQNCEPPCASLGGEVPPEATEDKCSEELEGLGMTTPVSGPVQPSAAMTCDKLQDALTNFKPVRPRQGKLPPIPAATPPACPALPPSDPSQPFNGADIIFVHGLKLQHICDRAHNVPGALKNWPASPG